MRKEPKKKEVTRPIRKNYRFTLEEAKELERKVKITGLPESTVIRMLIKGYEPRPEPGESYHKNLREFYSAFNKIEFLLWELVHKDKDLTKEIREAINKCARFQYEVERYTILPEKSKMKWE